MTAPREHKVPRHEVEYAIYRARDLLEWGMEQEAWALLDRMTRRIGSSEVGPRLEES